MKKPQRKISRKDFIKKSSIGVMGAGILANKPLMLWANKKVPEKRILGRTGIEVTLIGFGASRTQVHGITRAALDTGINFIDTGRSYANGQNEVMVGEVIKHIRKDLIIQSKVKIRLSEQKNNLHTSEVKKKIHDIMEKSLNESLAALQTDYIDIWLLHGAETLDMINHKTILDFFSRAKKEGRIRACGFSTHHNQVELLKSVNGSKFYDVIMATYNHAGMFVHSNSGHKSEYDQKALESELQTAHKNGIGVIAMKTCSGGPCSSQGNEEANFGKAVKWVLEKPYIDSAAVAMANFDEIQENTRMSLNSQALFSYPVRQIKGMRSQGKP